MSTTLKTEVTKYLRAKNLARGAQAEYHATLRKRTDWGVGVPIERHGR